MKIEPKLNVGYDGPSKHAANGLVQRIYALLLIIRNHDPLTRRWRLGDARFNQQISEGEGVSDRQVSDQILGAVAVNRGL